MIDVEKTCDRCFGGIDPTYMLPPCPDQAIAQACIRQEPLKLAGEILRISLSREQSSFSMTHHFRDASCGSPHDSRSRQQRFDQREP
jgi:hypothetical protein